MAHVVHELGHPRFEDFAADAGPHRDPHAVALLHRNADGRGQVKLPSGLVQQKDRGPVDLHDLADLREDHTAHSLDVVDGGQRGGDVVEEVHLFIGLEDLPAQIVQLVLAGGELAEHRGHVPRQRPGRVRVLLAVGPRGHFAHLAPEHGDGHDDRTSLRSARPRAGGAQDASVLVTDLETRGVEARGLLERRPEVRALEHVAEGHQLFARHAHRDRPEAAATTSS